MPYHEPYTCARCPSVEPPVRRCKRCCKRRAAVVAARRAAKFEQGVCADCPATAIPGQRLCEDCQTAANARTAAHHAKHRDVANRARRKLYALRST